MVWIDTKEISSPILSPHKVIEVIDIRNTVLIAVLTPDTVIILHESTLIPLATHYRDQESIERFGNNKRVKIKRLDLGPKADKLNIVNLFLTTDNDYLIIYQLSINPNTPVYDIFDKNSSTVLQKLIPVNSSSSNTFLQMLNSITRNLTSGEHLNLESIENFNNYTNVISASLDLVKLNIFKTIKVGIGIGKFYLKSNSHNLFIYNNFFIQVINVKTMGNEVFKITDFDWYNVEGGIITDIWYNNLENYFLFVTEEDELWYLTLGDNESDPVGYKIYFNIKVRNVQFNPVSKLIAVETEIDDGCKVSIYKFDNSFTHCIDLKIKWDIKSIQWSNNGEFLVILNTKGQWLLSSKFGNIYSNTEDLSNESNDDIHTCHEISISSDDNFLILINNDTKQVYKVTLHKLLNSKDMICVNSNYFSVVEENKFIKFPLSTSFKHSKIQNLKISKNFNNQFIISGSDKLSVSNPYKTGPHLNHVIWFNFKNYYMETLNITNHVNYKQFLILINKTTEDVGVQTKIINELIIINLEEDSLYGSGGQGFKFDSDLFIWRKKFPDILTFELCDNNLIILDVEFKLFIFEMVENYQTKSGHKYKLFMRLKQTIDLSTMQDKLLLPTISKITLLENLNFLILMSSGEFFLLKNESNKILLTTYFQLIKINTNIEDFNISDISINDEIVRYIYLFQGPTFLVYNLTHLIDLIFNPMNDPIDGLEEIEAPDDIEEDTQRRFELNKQLINPIVIDLDNFQPLKIQKSVYSINLIGIQDTISSTEFIKIKLSSRLILNDLIEFDLKNKVKYEVIISKFSQFKNFNYCLELLLFNYLSGENPLIHKLIALIKFYNNYEVFINCLRKIEFKRWSYFFESLDTTPMDFMKVLIDSNNVKLGYNFLIIYLNLKSDNEDANYLNAEDENIILNLFDRLVKLNYWDWCFELCRFIKLLDPSSKILIQIRQRAGTNTEKEQQKTLKA